MGLRGLVQRGADALGVNRLILASPWRSRRLLILCYHGFALRDEHQWDPELFMSPATFRSRLRRLQAARCNVLPLGEGLTRLQDGTLPPRAVCLTVDDGLYDFAAVACPLLQEFGYHATVYASTYYIEHPWPVFNVMASYLLWLGARRGVRSVRLALSGAEPLPLDNPASRAKTLDRIKTDANREGISGGEKNSFLPELAGQLGIDYDELLRSRVLSLMRPAELQSLDPRIADVQLHTHRHRVPEDRELFLREIEDNRHILGGAGLQRSALVHFCYPSGVVREPFLPWLREAGVQSAVTGRGALATSKSELLLLPRLVDTEAATPSDFEAMLSGLRALLSREMLYRANTWRGATATRRGVASVAPGSES